MMKITQVTLETVKDVLPLFEAYRTFYGQPKSEVISHFLNERIQLNESTIFLARIDGEAAGFVQLYPTFSSVACKRAFILNDLYVAEAYRKRGVAQKLMEKCYDYCIEQEATYMTLETSVSNEQAQKLYKKMGMVVDKEFLHYTKGW